MQHGVHQKLKCAPRSGYSARLMSSPYPLFPGRRAMTRAVLVAAGLGVALTAIARPWWVQGTAAPDHDFLDPDIAFRVGATLHGDEVHVRWTIADGYYLYRDRIRVLPESPDLAVGPVALPPGTVLTDAYLGAQQVYHHQVEAVAPLVRSDFGAHPVEIKVSYQGCAEAGLCYPTITKVLFPQVPASAPATAAHPPLRWQLVAMAGGLLAFLVAGLAARRGRRNPPSP